MSQQVLGAIVHYVAPGGPETEHGHCQAAIIVGTHIEDRCDLAVVMTHPGMANGAPADVVVHVDVPRNDRHQFGSWHERWQD